MVGHLFPSRPKQCVLAGALAVALLTASGAASAGSLKDDAAPASDREFSWSMTIGATSDYVSRGYSQTKGDPALQGSLDIAYGIFYAGVWGSNVDFAGDKGSEIDLYLGIKPVVGPVTFDLGVLYYLYPGIGAGIAETDYVELKAAANATFHDIGIGGLIYYAPDLPGVGPALTTEGSLSYTLPAMGSLTPSISGALGHLTFEDDSSLDYNYWNVGVGLAIDKIAFDLRYWDTDAAGCTSDTCDERFVATAKITLP